MKPKDMATHYKLMETNLLTWLAIHGNLCLALRHPQNVGASRNLVLNFVKVLGKTLVRWGVVTQEELDQAEKTEIEQGSFDFADH